MGAELGLQDVRKAGRQGGGRDFLAEAGVLDGIPDEIDAVGPLAEPCLQGFGDRLRLIGAFVGGIDEHQPAFLGGGNSAPIAS